MCKLSSVGFFSKVASLVLSAMRTFPKERRVRICFIYDKWIKTNSNLPSKTLYYVLILLDLMTKWQSNKTSENNQSRINVFIDWAQGTDRKFLHSLMPIFSRSALNLIQSLSVCHEHCPFFFLSIAFAEWYVNFGVKTSCHKSSK